ncbi:oligosaccharide repeat unit polymerase [Ferruginibacter lapsinanis]|uniref:O-antigen polymerase n=1 Tax=Ferruginibacter lapsinanis TaxID=563172 RepID=UPI001E5B66EE|nr:O-antigen polymerase [Ferruginibacter lapsinanis]UEG50573.1 oligosaccharide repeat unit polymerase [Ferruginibacter lapsinanis]
MDQQTIILTDIVFILLHLFVFLFNYTITSRKVFQPAVLFSFVWFSIILLHFILRHTILDQLYPVGVETYMILFVGVVTFSLGSLLVTGYNQLKNTEVLPSDQSDLTLSLTLRIIFLGIVVIGLPLYIQASIRVFLASQIDDFFQGLRNELSYGDEDIGPTKYLISLSFVVFAISYYSFVKEKGKLNRVLFITSFLVTVVYALLATGRTYFFIILSIYLGISYFHKKNFSLKKYGLLLIGFLLVFILFGMLYGKGGDLKDSLKDNLQASSETTGVYLVSSITALDNEIGRNVKARYPGEYTLRFFIKTGQQLNLVSDKKVSSLVSDFVFVPYPTNVFTFYSPYIRDFGKMYAWLMIGLFGALHTWIYHRSARTKNLRNTLYYSFLLFPLLMSFFQDQYMSLFSFWLQIMFFIELFLFLDVYFKVRKDKVIQS